MKRPNIDKSRFLRRNQTDAERKLWGLLRNRQMSGVKFRRQFSIKECILDFYAPEHKLALEIDGGQHFDEEGLKRDQERTKKLNDLNIQVLRFDNREVLTNMDGVYELILRAVEERQPPHLNSLLQGERKDKLDSGS